MCNHHNAFQDILLLLKEMLWQACDVAIKTLHGIYAFCVILPGASIPSDKNQIPGKEAVKVLLYTCPWVASKMKTGHKVYFMDSSFLPIPNF